MPFDMRDKNDGASIIGFLLYIYTPSTDFYKSDTKAH